ncbi:MAG: carbohydrate binding family 9 domain-containing protein [Myxococcales bacterium]|nr:carbohydrate binding family 9 domain-containing protein [Myxococcales bacterium]
MWLLVTMARAAAPVTVGDARGIVLDGVLDEAAWSGAAPVTDFVRFRPTAGGAPPGRTEVRFLQDDQAFYVGIRVSGTDDPVRARISPREDINSDDQVGIYLDTYHDQRSGYVFYLNPLGIQQDIRVNGSNDWSVSWDTVLRSRGRVDDDGRGYTIELAIPWRSLKFRPGSEQTWGVMLTRKVPGLGAKYAYPVLQEGHPALWSQEAELRGVRPPRAGSGLELIPSLLTGRSWTTDPVTGAPPDLSAWGGVPWTETVRPSLDLRWGATPDLGLAAAVNPDFSQVEADVADVRLNPRFAFQFAERRPLFLDGIDAYVDRLDTLYTRSIANPLYGVKLTGRQERVSVGVLHALDRSPLGSFHEDGAPGFEARDDVIAADTFARFRLDAFESGQIGLSVADKRLLPAPGSPTVGEGELATYDGYGLDASLPVGGRWSVDGSVQGSGVNGPEGSLAGMATELVVTRATGVGTGMQVAGSWFDEGFRQELGFRNFSGFGKVGGSLDHTFATRGAVQLVRPSVYALRQEELDDEHQTVVGTSGTVVAGANSAWIEGSGGDRRFQGVTLPQWSVAGGVASQAGRTLEVDLWGSGGQSLDFRTLGSASDLYGEATTSLRATVATRLDLTASAARHVPQGSPVETAWFQRARFTWQFTRPLGTRWIVQHDLVQASGGRGEGLLVSALLTWLSVPGTAAYVGWTERIDLGAGSTTDRSVFVKASVLFRP